MRSFLISIFGGAFAAFILLCTRVLPCALFLSFASTYISIFKPNPVPGVRSVHRFHHPSRTQPAYARLLPQLVSFQKTAAGFSNPFGLCLEQSFLQPCPVAPLFGLSLPASAPADRKFFVGEIFAKSVQISTFYPSTVLGAVFVDRRPGKHSCSHYFIIIQHFMSENDDTAAAAPIILDFFLCWGEAFGI